MKFDRNTVIGFLIMGVLLFGYIYYNSLEQAANRKNVAREQFVKDSIDKATAQLDGAEPELFACKRLAGIRSLSHSPEIGDGSLFLSRQI